MAIGQHPRSKHVSNETGRLLGRCQVGNHRGVKQRSLTFKAGFLSHGRIHHSRVPGHHQHHYADQPNPRNNLMLASLLLRLPSHEVNMVHLTPWSDPPRTLPVPIASNLVGSRYLSENRLMCRPYLCTDPSSGLLGTNLSLDLLQVPMMRQEQAASGIRLHSAWSYVRCRIMAVLLCWVADLRRRRCLEWVCV